MEQKISWFDVVIEQADILKQTASLLEIESSPGGGGFSFSCEGFSAFRYLVCDLELLTDHSQPFFLYFWKPDSPEGSPFDFRVMSGIQPFLPVTWSFDFNLLDSQSLFPYRTPGRQKMVIAGKRTSIGELSRATFHIKESFHPVKLRLMNLRLTTEEPAYQKTRVNLMDEMGQYIPKQWPGKQHSVDAMVENIRHQYEASKAFSDVFATASWDKWGGWKEKKLTEGTGFFATHHDGRRFWLVDPDGCAFFSIGPDCVGGDRATRVDVMEHVLSWIPPDDEYPEAISSSLHPGDRGPSKTIDFPMINLIRTFGPEWKPKWVRMTANRMRAWGFNTVGNWTDIDFCRESKMPYVIPLDRGHAFPTTPAKIFRDFPDVFSDEYSRTSDLFASNLADFKDDPYLIGYFMCNEPNWAFEEGLNLGAEVLASKETLVTRERLIAFLSQRYNNQIEILNQAWQTRFADFADLNRPIKDAHRFSAVSEQDLGDFMEEMIREYVTVPSKACRKADPNHLNLGMRWGWIHNKRQVAGWENYDVFSINCYSFDPRPAVEAVAAAGVNRPVMIGEFHHGALDGATTATGIRGVKTQHERGQAYRYYVENGATTTNLVGCHYFDYNDQSAIGRYDGENYNIGFVDACHQPYQEMIQAALATAEVLYEVADGRKPAYSDLPAEIPSIFY